MKKIRAYLSTLLIAALVITSLPVAAAPAASPSTDLVSTQSVLANDSGQADRERIHQLLNRADIQDALVEQGVVVGEPPPRDEVLDVGGLDHGAVLSLGW